MKEAGDCLSGLSSTMLLLIGQSFMISCEFNVV